jgi:hypothetical protein
MMTGGNSTYKVWYKNIYKDIRICLMNFVSMDSSDDSSRARAPSGLVGA